MVSNGEPGKITDMRVEVVKRELSQGALAGFDSAVTDYAARLVLSALDSFDEATLQAEFRRGFELGDQNSALLVAEVESPSPPGSGAAGHDRLGWIATPLDRRSRLRARRRCGCSVPTSRDGGHRAVTDLSTLTDAADALTQPIHNVERIFDRDAHRNRQLKRVWVTNQPSLLEQLAAAVVPGEVYAEDQNGAKLVPRSIPPARLEAINALLMIEAGSVMWVVRVGLTIRETATDNIRALVGASLTSDDTTEALSDLRRWYGWASTLTGWEVPAWTPQAPCPACDERTLRVRLERKTATCVACREFWTEDTIGILGAHVEAYDRWSRAEAKAARLREAEAQRERAGQTRREVS